MSKMGRRNRQQSDLMIVVIVLLSFVFLAKEVFSSNSADHDAANDEIHETFRALFPEGSIINGSLMVKSHKLKLPGIEGVLGGFTGYSIEIFNYSDEPIEFDDQSYDIQAYHYSSGVNRWESLNLYLFRRDLSVVLLAETTQVDVVG